MRRGLPVLLLLSACRFDATPPAGVIVTCARDLDCPKPLVCEPTLSWCISSSSPFATTPTVTPPRGRAGTTFTATLGDGASGDVTAWSSLGHPVRFTGAGAGAYTYTADGTEDEGRFVLLYDGPGAHAVRAGALELDFTGPTFTEAHLQLTPGANNGLLANGLPGLQRAANAGTKVDVDFSVRDVMGPVTAWASLDGGALPLTEDVARASGDHHVFTLTVDDLTPEGAWPVVAEAADDVGNMTRAPLDITPFGLAVDRTNPPPPDNGHPTRIVYTRAAPSFSVEGQPGAVEGAGLVVAYAQGLPVSRALSDTDGGFGVLDLPLLQDAPSVSVRFIDLAGNSSLPVEVLNGVYVRSPEQRSEVKVAQDLALPWRVATDVSGLKVADDAGVRVPSGWVAVTEDFVGAFNTVPRAGATGGYAYCFSTCAASTPWLLGGALDGGSSVQNRRFAASAYMNTSGPVLFGGEYQGSVLGDTRLFANVLTVNGPNPSARTRMAYGSNTYTGLVIAGGQLASGQLTDEVWRLTGPAGVAEWNPLPTGFSPRQGAAGTSATNQFWLYGGEDDAGVRSDLWHMLSDAGWESLQSSTVPPPRTGHGLASCDGLTLVLAGGRSPSTGALLDDTWLFNADGGWRPGPRLSYPVAETVIGCDDRGRIYATTGLASLDGGAPEPTRYSQVLNGRRWVRALEPLPIIFDGVGVAADPVGQRVLLAGSEACGSSCDGTKQLYQWDGEIARAMPFQLAYDSFYPAAVWQPLANRLLTCPIGDGTNGSQCRDQDSASALSPGDIDPRIYGRSLTHAPETGETLGFSTNARKGFVGATYAGAKRVGNGNWQPLGALIRAPAVWWPSRGFYGFGRRVDGGSEDRLVECSDAGTRDVTTLPGDGGFWPAGGGVDVAHDRLYFYGAYGFSGDARVWRWDGQSWAVFDTPYILGTPAWSSWWNELVFTGGLLNWTRLGPSGGRPAARVSVLPPPGPDLVPLEVRVDVTAFGSGVADGGALDGVDVLWSGVTVGSGSGVLALVLPLDAGQVLLFDGGTVLEVRTRGVGGDSPAELLLDQVVQRLRYRVTH